MSPFEVLKVSQNPIGPAQFNNSALKQTLQWLSGGALTLSVKSIVSDTVEGE